MGGRRDTLVRVAMAVGAVAGFLFAIQLLGAATGRLAPTLRTTIQGVVDGDAAALGSGWVAAYLLLNGTVVAAVALTLFGAHLVTAGQLLLLIAGSRLGAAGVVLVVGAVDHLRNPRGTTRESMGLGVLAFLATYSVYLPATLASYLAVPFVGDGVAVPVDPGPAGFGPLSVFDPLLARVLDVAGPGPSFLLALLVVVASLSLFDRLFRSLDTERLRRRYVVRLRRPAVSFLAGTVLTAATTSVAFSLGVVVPLYNRNVVKREEILPFILGASLGTLSDTLVAALALGLPGAVAVVVVLLVAGTVFSLLVLATYGTYARTIGRIHDRILSDRWVFRSFVVSLLLVPLALLAL